MIKIVACVAIMSVLITTLSILGVEKKNTFVTKTEDMDFVQGLKEIWRERKARNFSIFVFLSMTAYFMQELILEPYAGLVFGFTPGESTSLSGIQNGGVFIGMISVGILCTGLNLGNLRLWVITGCIGSALSLSIIAVLGLSGSQVHLTIAVISLGFFNGMFAVGAIGSMMSLAGQGRNNREGTRVGIWGAAQAIAAGFGGLLGASLVDMMRLVSATDATAYGTVFIFEAALFICSSALAVRIMPKRPISFDLVPGE